MPATTLRRRDLFSLLLLPAAGAASAPPGMSFPLDFGSHPQSKLEWWYLTGILGGADDLKLDKPLFGYQLTFFRLKGPAPADHPSAFAAHQLLLAHGALSDLSAGRLRHEQRVARAGFGLAGAGEADSDLRIRDWTLRREAGGYRAALHAGSFAVELSLKTTQPLLLQGEQGWSRKGSQQYSHYYSEPQLRTAARLELDGRRVAPLQGRSWLDHEWSDAFLGNEAVGWDWAGINLDDGGALTVFQLRRADGSVSWTGGSWRAADGAMQSFETRQIQMQALRRWHSPASGADYPVEWVLQTPLGTLRLRAIIDAQEIDARSSTGFRYWEGAAVLQGADGRRIGLGYLELTGYGGTLSVLP